MITLDSYLCGSWQTGGGERRVLHHAVTGEPLAEVASGGLDFAAALEHGRRVGGPALRALTFRQRAGLLRQAAKVLGEHLEELYAIAATYGATKKDAWIDIEGGIAAAAVLASLGRRGLPEATFLVDGDAAPLSRDGGFAGRHVWVPLEGVAIQINAYNFPSWGMLEKLAPAVLAGMPSLVKPATASAWLAHRMVQILIEAEVFPEGSLQLVCGSVGDLLDHLTCQDVVGFTGSASTGRTIRSHPAVVANAVRVNVEADSLNAAVLGPDAAPGSAMFDAFVKEVAREMTVKAGQKCTAIRRALVPAERQAEVIEALRQRLGKITVGDPARDEVRMGPLVDRQAVATARAALAELAEEAEIVFGDPERQDFAAEEPDKGAFMEPVLLRCREPRTARKVHEVEVFGPASTVLAYADADEAVQLARRGGGSLVASAFTEDDDFARRLAFGIAPFHGRLMLIDPTAAGESTGHGIVMPQLVHGGPGRAGGGEELGGLRSLHHYMQRVAIQGSPQRLDGLCAPALGE